MFANTRQTYGLVAQVLHWITVLLVLLLLVLGIYMHELPVDTAQQVDSKIWLYSLHKTLGILAFSTAIIRVFWALIQVRPYPVNGGKKLETLLAGTVHWLLYANIILMPITGWMHHAAVEGFAPIWWPLSQELPFIPKDPQLAKFFGNAHFTTALLLMGSLVLHIAGALKHVVIDHDQTLARIIPGKSLSFASALTAPSNKLTSFVLAGVVLAGLIGVVVFSHNFSVENLKPVTDYQITSGTAWVVDHEKSKLEIEIMQGGKPVVGSFANWQAAIEFDPDNIERAKVLVKIDIASLSLGSVTEQAISKGFLNAAENPQAEFASEKFTKTGDGKFSANGELILAGKAKPFILPFELNIENGRAFMTSLVEVERLEFGIGQTGFSTDSNLGFIVQIKVDLEAELK